MILFFVHLKDHVKASEAHFFYSQSLIMRWFEHYLPFQFGKESQGSWLINQPPDSRSPALSTHHPCDFGGERRNKGPLFPVWNATKHRSTVRYATDIFIVRGKLYHPPMRYVIEWCFTSCDVTEIHSQRTPTLNARFI